jgi:hypothetical protein
MGNYKTTIAGSSGADGSLDYKLKMDVPAGKLGSQFNSLVGGTKSDPNAMVPLNIGLGGNFLNPTPKLLMDEQKQQVKNAATTAVKQEATKKADELVSGLLGKPKPKSDTAKAKTDSTKTTTKPADQIKKDATNAIKGLLKKKKG